MTKLTSEQQQVILELLKTTPRSNKEILAFLRGDDVSDDGEAESDFSDDENDFCTINED